MSQNCELAQADQPLALVRPLHSPLRMRSLGAPRVWLCSLLCSLAASASGCALYYEPDDGVGGGGVGEGGGGGGEGEPRPLPTGSFHLKVVRSMAGELPIAGVDSDGAGGLWLAYRLAIGAYYEPDDVRVVHLGPNGEKLSEWRYNDEYTDVRGIAFGAGAVWLNYNATGTGNNHIRKLDPATGARLGSFATDPGVVDLDVRGEEILQSNLWNDLISTRVSNGGEQGRRSLPGIGQSLQRGVATTADHKVWLADAEENRVQLFDSGYRSIGTGLISYPEAVWDSEGLAWDGERLVLATRSQILWLAPQ